MNLNESFLDCSFNVLELINSDFFIVKLMNSVEVSFSSIGKITKKITRYQYLLLFLFSHHYFFFGVTSNSIVLFETSCGMII